MTTLHVQGMKCQHCAAATQKVFEELGAKDVKVDLAKAEVRFEGQIDKEALRKAISAQGYTLTD